MKIRPLLRWCAILLVGLAGCLRPANPVVNLSESVQVPEKTAVIFFVDGMDRTRMHEMVAAGALPAIRKYFIDGGVSVDYAVTSMPAITYPNAVSLITGCFPGHHGILGNIWFDRTTLEVPDYLYADSYRDVNQHFERKTIFEILDDQFTVNVQCHTRRGVSHSFDNVLATGLDWYTHNFSGVDDRVGYTFSDVIHLANSRRRWPVLMTYYFPGVDETGHRHGSDSQRYAYALQVADHSIGLVCDAIMESDLADRTYFVLMTDHNHVLTPPENILDISKWLGEEIGLRVLAKRLTSKSYDRRLRQLGKYDALVFTEAGRRAVIHLRGHGGWHAAADPAQILRIGRELIEFPGVSLALWRAGPDRVQVTSKTGAAIVERKLEGSIPFYLLQTLTGDPLGYLASADLRSFVEQGWHDSRSWLRHTARYGYPDFVPQVASMFESHRVGDLVLFAAENWSFDGWRGGHGSAAASDMRVPLYFAGPDLPNGGRIDHARTVDIMPTVLDLLGRYHLLESVQRIDGLSIAGELRNAGARPHKSTAEDVDSGDVLPHAGDQPLDVRPGHVEPVGRSR